MHKLESLILISHKHTHKHLFLLIYRFGNHYARDSLGALELQMETDLGITSEQFATINSIYFIPSIFAPVLAGIFTGKNALFNEG